MFILRDALPADNPASGGEVTGAAAAPKPMGFKEAARDFLEKNPDAPTEEPGTEGEEPVDLGEQKEVGKEVKKEPEKEPFDPLKDDESDTLGEGDEITEIGVMNEKGEFEKRKFVDVLDQAEFTLKHNNKLVKVNGYEKLKTLAQQGLNSTKINTEAKRVFAENQQIRASWEQTVNAKALEIANSMYKGMLEEEMTVPADQQGQDANAKMYRLLQKQIEDMKTETQTRLQREEQQRQFQASEVAKQHWAGKAQEIGEQTLEPFKPYFKDASQKHDEVAFTRFQRDVKIETRDALEQLQAEGHQQVFTPEEVGEIMKKMARKVYKDMDSLVERRYQAKVALKKKGSGAAALTPGNTGTGASSERPRERVTFKAIKAGKFG